MPSSDIEGIIVEKVIDVLLAQVEERDSGWSMVEIIHLQVNINRYDPLVAGESTWIALPQFIQNKKAVLNIKNNDQCCFFWAATAALFPAENNINSTSSYPDFRTIFKYQGINFPTTLYDIPTFELDNNLSINVYGLKNKDKIVPSYLNLSRLVSSQISNGKTKKFLCNRCLCHFKFQQSFDNHREDCIKMNKTAITFPENDEKIKFKNHKNKEQVPFVVYADLECILEPDDTKQKHIPCSVAFYAHCSFDKSKSYFSLKRDVDCIDWFIGELKKLSEHVKDTIKHVVPMKPLTFQQQKAHNDAKKCHICAYRGPAHNRCNLNYQSSHIIPVVFHNLSGYDSHFLIKSLVSTSFEGKVELLPINKEKYIAFTKTVDSFRFMASSIDQLASFLDNDKKNITKRFYNDLEKFKLVVRKGVFPYEYIDDWDKLNETQLPAQSAFYSKLNNANISDEDCQHALTTDVLLLADIFENFRENCLAAYNLDPLHYLTAPGLAFDAMLKYTEIELDPLQDVEMLNFIEKGIRGGVSQCSNRYAKANNHYMGDKYDQNKDESHLMYFDVNNLYGAAMSEYLPTVDLDYPQSLNEHHKDLPVCPEHWQPPDSKCEKLMTTLLLKNEYVIHYRNLQQCIELGLKITKIHRVLQFKQSAWLKKYIDLNTEMRKKSKNDFEKNFFKLMNNAVYGKTMENVRNYKDIKLITKWEGRWGAQSLISQPNFHSSVIFDDDMIV
ncbi:uncharacterized protein [Chelonus insularis]|uniref:uncharacterized protein n=1 Tax=Chelonus insularis TaxID=460826 RepID=UPI0015887DEF|nr:uncharacterized protein LOC118065318 [Chelonus insularis]